jgi:hypothetical protein
MAYPNPTSSIISIKGLLPQPCRISVWNALGQIVFEEEACSSEWVRKDVSFLPTGLYKIRFQQENQLQTISISILNL